LLKICPSLASADVTRLGDVVRELDAIPAGDPGRPDMLHLDVEDGVFVPNLTFGWKMIAGLRKLTQLPFDVHLMVSDPERYLDQFAAAGAQVLTVHVEACPYPRRLLVGIARRGMKPGLALNPRTPIEVVRPYLDDITTLLLLTAEPDGARESMLPGAAGRVAAARRLVENRDIDVAVDGAVDAEHLIQLYAAGATKVVAGRAVFGSSVSVRQAIANLRLLVS